MSNEYRRMRFALILGLVVGCGTTPNPKSCLDNHCSDPDLPFCDTDGSIGGEPNTCIAVDCAPNTFKECRGERALTCNAAGDNYEQVECEFGCGANGCLGCDTPECEARIVPRFVPNACDLLAATPSLVISENTTLNTSDVSCMVVQQESGLEICVLKYGTIKIEAGRTLRATGSRALALVADYAFDLDGTLDASADFGLPGAGSGTRSSGMNSATDGGGGAGYRHQGGSGGSGAGTGGATNGGSTAPGPLQTSELLGGTRPLMIANTGTPGLAGGAVTLVSCRGTLSVTGMIDAGGGGGAAGRFVNLGGGNFFYRPPTGGGSGGTIALQGVNLRILGSLYANGGGGGGGGELGIDGIVPGPGQDGLRATTPASGGGGSSNGLPGGPGGTELPPGNGIGNNQMRGGAGGGSAGFIVVYTPESILPVLTPTEASPMISPRQSVPLK